MPLDDSASTRVLWHDDAGWPTLPSAPLPTDVDVVVVGAGYCGLAAAAAVAAEGASVCLVDRGGVGDGASSRNGGMVIPELKSSPAQLRADFGELGIRLQRDVDAAFDFVESLIHDGPIDCSYGRTGQLFLAHNDRAARHLDDIAPGFGSGATVLRGDELAEEIGSTRFPAGMAFDRTGGLQPARFHAGLMRRAVDAGAAIHHDTEVTSLERRARGHTVRTGRGDVRCSNVLVATNAYATEGLARFGRRVLPVGSFIAATPPLPADVAADILPTGRMCFDTKNYLWYWRLDAHDRLVFGGRRHLGATTPEEARSFLARSIREVYPQLGDVDIDTCWGGFVAITLDRLPHAGTIDGVHYAQGCNGSGVALNTYLGHRMGLAIMGGPLPACAELTDRAIPARSMRSWYLPIVGRWFEWQDRRS